jgi:hypothetical protein
MSVVAYEAKEHWVFKRNVLWRLNRKKENNSLTRCLLFL